MLGFSAGAFLAWASDDPIGAPIVIPCLELYAWITHEALLA